MTKMKRGKVRGRNLEGVKEKGRVRRRGEVIGGGRRRDGGAERREEVRAEDMSDLDNEPNRAAIFCISVEC